MTEINSLKTAIREADINDVKLIHDLANEIWPLVYSYMISEEQIHYMLQLLYNEEELKNQIIELNHHFILIFVNEKAVGFASWSAFENENEIAKLHKLYLLLSFHKQGLGKLLIEEIYKKTRVAGFNKLRLNVNRENKTLSFYLKEDFTIIQSLDIPLGKFLLNDYIMEKNL